MLVISYQGRGGGGGGGGGVVGAGGSLRVKDDVFVSSICDPTREMWPEWMSFLSTGRCVLVFLDGGFYVCSSLPPSYSLPRPCLHTLVSLQQHHYLSTWPFPPPVFPYSTLVLPSLCSNPSNPSLCHHIPNHTCPRLFISTLAFPYVSALIPLPVLPYCLSILLSISSLSLFLVSISLLPPPQCA